MKLCTESDGFISSKRLHSSIGRNPTLANDARILFHACDDWDAASDLYHDGMMRSLLADQTKHFVGTSKGISDAALANALSEK